MSISQINKVVGAVLVSVFLLFSIGKIGDNLVREGGGHDATPAVVAVRTPPASVAPPKPAEPEVPFSELLARADVDRGKKVFNKCKACHTVADGGKDGIGPNLWNVVNATPAVREGFNYSNALESLADKPWTYDNLNQFLTSPKTYAKGTKMTFAGLRKAGDRANVIAYLRSLSDNPAPLE